VYADGVNTISITAEAYTINAGEQTRSLRACEPRQESVLDTPNQSVNMLTGLICDGARLWMCEGAMARLVWALICEHHTTDASGKNSYNGVFDEMTLGITARPGDEPPTEPLPFAVSTTPFVLAMHLLTKPGDPECTLRVKDSDGHLLVPEAKANLGPSTNGKHNWHVHFQRGIPVRKSGTYVFEISVEGEAMGRNEVELPIVFDIKQGKS
jgi:hypothetical protein